MIQEWYFNGGKKKYLSNKALEFQTKRVDISIRNNGSNIFKQKYSNGASPARW